MEWGIFDTEDEVWLGDEHGPITFDVMNLARVAAQIADVRLQQQPGRCRAQLLPESLRRRLRFRDRKETTISAEEALRGLEEGRFL